MLGGGRAVIVIGMYAVPVPPWPLRAKTGSIKSTSAFWAVDHAAPILSCWHYRSQFCRRLIIGRIVVFHQIGENDDITSGVSQNPK